MTSWLSFALLAAAAAVAITEARAVPADRVSLSMDSYGNPVIVLREKRTPAGPYPHRAMMFTGYYRPVRRSNGQATGVFAQGNAVSGNAYLSDGQQDYLQRGPEPIDESEVSSAEAEAAPNPVEHDVHDESQHDEPAQEDQQDQPEIHSVQEQDEEAAVYTPEAPVAQEPEVHHATGSRRPSKKQGPKISKKRPIPVATEEEDESEDEEDDNEENDEPASPFVPFKSDHRRQGNVPSLNNFFPMVFSFPRGLARDGSSSAGSPPGMITAIANSYSTAKGGVASSMATAYGGSPQGKKQRRAQPVEE